MKLPGNKMLTPHFWKGRRVLLTGHTGFKGAWATLMLENMGAEVTGVSLPANTNPNLYDIILTRTNLKSISCDIRDAEKFKEIVVSADPEIVIHMAAQPLVRESYHKPVETIETNVMGTVYLLESLKFTSSLLAVLVVTSDKVYANHNESVAMTEASPLGGHDPYSASKAATEIVTAAYAKSFFTARGVPICTARAGNVIGGGDWAKDRIIPDLWRAYSNNERIELRYPEAVRPWQHVLDPIYGYLLYVEHMVTDSSLLPSALNFGPSTKIIRTVLDLAERFSYSLGVAPLWATKKSNEQLVESTFLSIDSSLAKLFLGWRSSLEVDDAIFWTCEWYKAFQNGTDMWQFTNKQIDSYLQLVRDNLMFDSKQTRVL